MTTLNDRGIPLSSISRGYLVSNSTSHTWPFSAVAELIDNAYDPDVCAEKLWINKTMVKGQDCLIFMDNGKGMDYNQMHKMLSFGFSNKQAVGDHVPVGLYGNGFKSGSMRLGKDAIVFSKKADIMCVGLLSQTYLEKTDAQNVIVPIVVFANTGQTVNATPEHANSLRDILTHSPFNTNEELLSEFNVDGLRTNSSGTRIIIWNLSRASSEKFEFDFRKNDIWIPVDVYHSTRETKKRQAGGGMSLPESEYSLRAYCSILYLKPRMQIILQGQKVETQVITKTLALAEVNTDTYKPTFLPSHEKRITITFGYNTKSSEHYGLMMYHKNRLIKAYERVACQRKADSRGVGVIGIIECNYLKPTHNKQDFDNTEEYRKTIMNVSNKLQKYWEDVQYSIKSSYIEPFLDTVKRPDPLRLQCNDCLKWRKIPDCLYEQKLHEKWTCSMNSDPQYRSCTVEEEPKDSNDEQPKYQKSYRESEQNQKLQQENIQQSPFTPILPIQTILTPSDDISTDSGTFSFTTRKKKDQKRRKECEGEDNWSISTQHPQPRQSPSSHMSYIQMTPKHHTPHSTDNFLLTTPKRKKNTQGLSQENPEKKKTKRKDFDRNIPDLSTHSSAMFSPASDANKAECIDIKTALKADGDDMIDKSTVNKEQSNQITQNNSKDPPNYKVLYMEAMEMITQLKELKKQVKTELKEEVYSLEDEKCSFSSYRESLKKDSVEVKRENEKVASMEDQWVQKKTEKDLKPRFLCSHAGQFHCKVTNLVFEMKGNGEVEYTLVSWDKSQLQGMGQYHPVGPLYNIKCSEDSIHYLHLPHCEIHSDKNQIELAVAHFSEGNMEILKPLKVTDTHVIIEVQHLSLYGLLKKWILRESPINAQVVLFYQNMQRRRKLHIHLLPGNVPIKEVQNQHEGNTYIQCTSLCQLIPGKKYRPLCEPYVSQPKLETFGYDYGPNYHPTFEVILNTEVEDLTLSLLDELGQEVWAPRQVIFTADIREAVPVVKDAEFVDKHRDALIQRVSSVMEIADTLLTKEIIRIEKYSRILAATTSQEKMRILFNCLDSGGIAAKAEFYKVLKEKQIYIVNDLNDPQRSPLHTL